MGLIRAGINVAKAAAKGGGGAEIATAGVKGMLPRSMGKIVDKVATPNNISRVTNGVRNVVDNGRGATFHGSTGSVPPPPPGGSNDDIWETSTPSSSAPPPPPSSDKFEW
jgi:hypothetical protein